MIKDLKEACGLPVSFDTESSELILGDGLRAPSYCVRNLHDLKAVWANPIEEDDQVIYRYTSALHLKEDAPVWKKANMAYGIVIFVPGTFSGEYVKSSGQYHPPVQPCNMGTPEIYTVLSGVGHFLLQKASPPFSKIEDAVMVEVQAGETFVEHEALRSSGWPAAWRRSRSKHMRLRPFLGRWLENSPQSIAR